MAQPDGSTSEPPPPPALPGKQGLLRKLFGRSNGACPSSPPDLPADSDDVDDPARTGVLRRVSRKVVPGLPRAQTFKRQQSESRAHLAPVETTPDERRAASVDRRSHATVAGEVFGRSPRTSAPDFFGSSHHGPSSQYLPSLPVSPAEDLVLDEKMGGVLRGTDRLTDDCAMNDARSIMTDTRSMTTSRYDNLIHDELETLWILNLSMHFRDRSKREKFFVTYREREHLWRRVTVSLDYRSAPPYSLELELINTKLQRDKIAKIYEAIRESLPDIQFYETVTNLKLQTTEGRLHVHVVEDGNEIIPYPTVNQFQHLSCPRVREGEITFGAHMSGFVYRVSVHGQLFIKKEIPGPDTIEEFIYEVNALSRLQHSDSVIKFYGIVVDDYDEHVKGLLISYADQGSLVDIIYDHCKESNFGLPWDTRERWARQIVQGLADIHESGFVQGDFTLSNIVIDDVGDAKIIDINRRGCPVGWEPPEVTGLIESGQRISMYIGVKSDLFQLGMVLWALGLEDDEPDMHARPLVLGHEVKVPDWYRQMTETCLSDDPRLRLQASSLLRMFPPMANGHDGARVDQPPISVDDGCSLQEYVVDGYHADGHPLIRTVEPPIGWPSGGSTQVDADPPVHEPYYYTRGRSPPSPLPSHDDRCESPRGRYDRSMWAANKNVRPSYSDAGADEVAPDKVPQQPTPTPSADRGEAPELRSADELGVIAGEGGEPADAVEAVAGAGGVTPTAGAVEVVPSIADDGLGAPRANDEAVLDSHHAETEAKDDDPPALREDVEQPRVDDAVTGADASLEDKPATLTNSDKAGILPIKTPPEVLTDPHGDQGEGEGNPKETNEEGDAKRETAAEGGALPETAPEAKEQMPIEQDKAAVPEQNASIMPGDTVPDAQAKLDTGLSGGSLCEPDSRRPVDGQSTTPSQPAAPKETDYSVEPATPFPTRDRVTAAPCRETKLPDSLTGVGAGHAMIDEELRRDTTLLDDDFGLEKRAERLPTLMITTDAET